MLNDDMIEINTRKAEMMRKLNPIAEIFKEEVVAFEGNCDI